MLQNASVMTEGPRLCGDGWLFQNIMLHFIVHATLTFLQKNRFNLLRYPACSSDLNPTEDIWGWMARDMYRNGKQYSTKNELQEAIFKSLSNIPRELMETLIKILACHKEFLKSLSRVEVELIIKFGLCIFRFLQLFYVVLQFWLSVKCLF